MPIQTWTVTDIENQIHHTQWSEELAPGVTARLQTLQGGKKQGVESLRIESDLFTFEVLPTRGMNIWKVWTGKFEFGWKSPVKGPVHPNWVETMEPGGLGWLDGFDELLVRCGLESNGAPEFDQQGRLQYPLHGRIANLPAEKLTVSINDNQVKITGVVEESRFHFMKMQMTSTVTWEIGTSKLAICDEIQNLSASDGECQMLYHINFGIPLLNVGTQLIAPVKTVVPRNEHAASAIADWQSYQGPTTGFEEQVYFLELNGDQNGDTQTVLKDADGNRGVAIDHNIRDLPCYTVWKNTTAIEDGYVTGLEPGTNFPNPRSFEGEQGRVIKIPGLGSRTMKVGLDFLSEPQAVQNAIAQTQKLMPDTTQTFDRPQQGWCHGVEN
ncbi:MAG: aldose 1-epimerase family protein [Pirellulaceae bacterium]|nr:aldose 1-epimerase family protein [Pirellulaceae bacterium]